MKIYEYEMVPFLVQEMAEPIKLNRAELVVDYMRGAFDDFPEQEQAWVIAVDRKNNFKGRIRISIGSQTGTLMHPREVFRPLILMGATAFFVVHNHPSGDPAPSALDLHVTRQLREGAKSVDIDLLDHVIIGSYNNDPLKRGYFSFREAGLI